jgi:ABC-type uncharacterized transport system auxiliary subunit
MWKAKGGFALAALVGFGAVLISACGSVPQTHYYTVAMPATAPKNSSRASLVLDIEPFSAPDILRDDRILFYHSPTELNYYEYHRWSSAPAEMVADLVARRLRDMEAFSDVRLFPRTTPGDFVLRGRLLNFEELDYEAGGKVRVGLELTLVRTQNHQVVWSDRRQTEKGIEGKGVASVVKSLDASTAELLNEILPGLATSVERTSGQRAESSQ